MISSRNFVLVSVFASTKAERETERERERESERARERLWMTIESRALLLRPNLYCWF